MIVCSNTSPIIFLSKINQLELLNKCFSNIFVPEAVLNELIDYPTPEFINKSKISDHGKAFVTGSLGALHRGELEAIVLARELKADFIILDDHLARKKAQRMGIKIIGTLGVLLLACKKGFISSHDVKHHINTLTTQHNMFISKTILKTVNEALDN